MTANYRTYRTGFDLLPSRCGTCGEDCEGLWCPECLTPYVQAGLRYLEDPAANVITTRYKQEVTK